MPPHRGRDECWLQDDAFTAWCEYARHVTNASPEDVRTGLDALIADNSLNSISRDLLRMRAAALGLRDATGALGAATDHVKQFGATRVTIFAGAAATMTLASRTLLKPILRRALDGYDGVVLTGGTSAGLPGLVGEAVRDLGLRAVGYAPAGRGDRDLYPRLHETDARDFGPLEPLAMWSDIFYAGIRIEDVRVVACQGGPITKAEILLARALGARVAWLDPPIAGPLDDALPFGAEGVLELPVDAMILRAFFRWSTAPDDHMREVVAQYMHDDYRRKQRSRKQPGDPALAVWEQLLPTLKESNRSQADDIPNKLAAVGKRLGKSGGRLRLNDEQVDLLAEIEHGRWYLERLRSRWQLGERQVARLVSDQLKPWDELDEKSKNSDREAVRNIDPALHEAGWGVVNREG